MAIINPDGLFGGDRLRRCSNEAQLHWPRLFLASDGFGRLELNYHKIIARAYSTFSPVPSEPELQAYLEDYSRNYLLFVYGVDGQLWGQWDTPAEFLKRYKTAIDRRSPIPPEPKFTEWKGRYLAESKAFPKCFGNISESFLHGVGVGGGKGDGKNICAPTGAPMSDSALAVSVDEPPFDTTESDALFPGGESAPKNERQKLEAQQDSWFAEWWAVYWLKKSRKRAREAFGRHVRTEARFQQVMEATRAQSPEMLSREPQYRPHGATWLNSERWDDDTAVPAAAKPDTAGDTLTRMIYGEKK